MAALTLKQGASETIRIDDIVDANGAPLDVTGWTVHAQARLDARDSVVLAEWHTTPTGSMQQATPSGTSVVLSCPHAASSTWTAWAGHVATVGIEVTSPGNQRVSFEALVYLKPETVR